MASRVKMLTAILLAALAPACVTAAQVEAAIEDASSCEAGDTCVNAGGSDCTCPQPVRANRAAAVNDLAARVYCNGVAVLCPTPENLRCETGRCVGDAPF